MKTILRVCTLLGLGLGCSAEDSGETAEHLGKVTQAAFSGTGNLQPGTNAPALAGTVSLTASAALSHDRLVTAAKVGTAASGALRVALWRLNDNQTFTSLAVFDSSSTVSTKVSVARADDNHFVVAARNSAGNLQVTAFAISDLDVISQTSVITAGAVSDVRTVAMNMSPGAFPFGLPPGPAGEAHIGVIYRASNTALSVRDYSIDGQGVLRTNGTGTAGAVAFVSGTYVSGTQPPAAWFSRSESSSERSAAACSDGSDNDADGYLDCSDWDCCGNAACSSNSTCTQGMIVTATPNNVSNMKLVSWRVDATGAVTRLQDAGSERALGIDATPLGFRRFATIRTLEGFPILQTWDITDDAGHMALHASFTVPFSTTSARLVNGGGARLWLQLTDSIGDGKLHTFDAIDTIKVGDVTDLFTRTWNNSPSLVSLAQDHVAITNFSSANALVVRSYRDFRQPLLQGSFQFSPPDTSTPQVNQAPFNVQPGLSMSGDTSLAVSNAFVLACGNGQTIVYDKAGNQLQSRLSHGTLFASVLSSTLGGVDNQQSINRHLAFPHLCDPRFPASAAAGQRNSCQDSFFDTDCTFDETRQRFVITSMLRFFGTSHGTKDRMQRYLGVAVSKTADPRQGFNVYLTTDNKFDDNPMMAANGGFITVSHQSVGEEPLEPSALVFDISSMTDPPAARIGNGKIAAWQTDGNHAMRAVNVRGSRTLNALYRYSSSLDGYQLFTFQRLADGPMQVFTDTSTDVAEVPSGPGGWYASNAWLQLNAFGDGEFYVTDHYPAGDGTERVRVTGADFFAHYDNQVLQGMNLIAFGGAVEALGCGGSFSCQNPSMARTADSTYVVYQRYRQDYRQCPSGVACASGVCVNSTCQANPTRPGVYFTRLDRFLTPFGASPTLIAAGSVVPVNADGPIFSRNSPNLEHSASMGDFGLNSVWYINAIPTSIDTDGNPVWKFSSGQIR